MVDSISASLKRTYKDQFKSSQHNYISMQYLTTKKFNYFTLIIKCYWFSKVVDIIFICIILITTNLEKPYEIFLLVMFCTIQLIFVAIILCQPQTNKQIAFKVKKNLYYKINFNFIYFFNIFNKDSFFTDTSFTECFY